MRASAARGIAYLVSSRSERAARRANERAHHRAAIDAVDPTAGGRAAHHVCLVNACHQRGPSIRYGEIVITLCARHKSEFDLSWQVVFDEVEIAG
jgi:hypothetical protein